MPTVYFGKEGDVAAAKQATEGVLSQGADFVIHQANAAAQGVFDACAEKKVYAFGSNLDQNDNASKAGIASAVIVAKPAFLDLAKQVKDKTYKGSGVLSGMADGAIDFKIAPAFKDVVPADLQTKLAELQAKIKSGELTVPKDEF